MCAEREKYGNAFHHCCDILSKLDLKVVGCSQQNDTHIDVLLKIMVYLWRRGQLGSMLHPDVMVAALSI